MPLQHRRWLSATLSAVLVLASACKTSERPAPADGDKDAAAAAALTAVAKPEPAPSPPVATDTPHGFRIAEFEYWPFRWQAAQKKCAYPYPTAVRYGFDGGSEAARHCMRQAYAQVWALLQAPPPALLQWRERGGPSSFALGINDFTAAKVDAAGEPVEACQPDPSMRRIWHYDPPAGQIRWIGEVLKDGRCRLPTAADFEAFYKAAAGN